MNEIKNSQIFVCNDFTNTVFKAFDGLRSGTFIESSDNNLILTGESGSGKSAICKKYRELNPTQRANDGIVVPVLYVELAKINSDKALYEQILLALGDPQQGRAKNASLLLERIEMLFHVCRVELLILDEAQTAVQNRRINLISEVCDWFKKLINKSKVPIVLSGMPWVTDMVGFLSQLDQRFGFRFSIPPYQISERFEDYQSFVLQFFEHFGYKNNAICRDIEFFTRLFAYTRGGVRITATLLHNVLTHQIDSMRTVSLKDFEYAINQRGEIHNNPFQLPAHKLKIYEQVHASRWNFEYKSNINPMENPIYRELKVCGKWKLSICGNVTI